MYFEWIFYSKTTQLNYFSWLLYCLWTINNDLATQNNKYMNQNHITPRGNVMPSTKNCNTENTTICTVQCLIKCRRVMTLSVTMVLTITLLIFLQDLGLVETCSVSCSPISVTLWFLLLYWLRRWPRLKGKGQDKKETTEKIFQNWYKSQTCSSELCICILRQFDQSDNVFK